MKKINEVRIIILLLLMGVVHVSASAQSLKLRYKYNKGDVYKFTLDFKQNLGPLGGLTMKVVMNQEVLEATEEKTVMKGNAKYISMDMMQAGQSMSYNSDMKDEELDASGKQVKAQVEPILKSVTTTTFDEYGKVTNITTEPESSGVSNESTLGFTYFPEEDITVGFSWTNEVSLQGVKLNLNFKVKEITESEVLLDVTGKLNMMGVSSDLTGEGKVDKNSGNTNQLIINSSISMQGVTASFDVNLVSEKM